MPSSPFFNTKGIDLTSAAALTLGSDGDVFHVTGATTITSISVRPAGFEITLIFNGALTVTHNATSLILQGGVNLTTVAGDVIKFVSEGSGNWRESSRLAAGSSIPAQWARGSIAGFLVENDGSNPNTDILINAGKCRDLAYSWAFGVDTGGTLTTSLVAYWKLDEASGIRKDSYGWYDMAAVRAAPTSTTGKQGAAALFSAASSQSLQVPANAQLRPTANFSYSCWVSLASKGANRKIIASAGSISDISIYFDNAVDRFAALYINSGATQYTATANNFGSPSLNTWHFIALTYNDSSKAFTISVNNGTADSTTGTGVLPADETKWAIGSDYNNASYYWDGRIDEVGYWRKVLSAQEITDLYNSGAGNTLTETLSDSTNLTGVTLIKRLTSAWSVGNNGGLLDTGSVTPNSTYHIFAINRPDTGVTDYIASLNPKKPTLPANYATCRRIRSIRTDGNGNLYKETQVGNFIKYNTTILDVSAQNPGTAALAATFSVPSGIRVWAQLNVGVHVPATSSSQYHLYVSELDTQDVVPSAGSGNPLQTIVMNGTATVGQNMNSSLVTVLLSRSRQSRYRIDTSDGSTIVDQVILGYDDLEILGAGR